LGRRWTSRPPVDQKRKEEKGKGNGKMGNLVRKMRETRPQERAEKIRNLL